MVTFVKVTGGTYKGGDISARLLILHGRRVLCDCDCAQLMYIEEQIRLAAHGSSETQHGLNLPAIKEILTAAGVSYSGNGDAVRATLKENLADCLACQGCAAPSGAGFLCAECHACNAHVGDAIGLFYYAVAVSANPLPQMVPPGLLAAADNKTKPQGGLNVEEIRHFLRSVGLSDSGKSAELRARLREYIQKQSGGEPQRPTNSVAAYLQGTSAKEGLPDPGKPSAVRPSCLNTYVHTHQRACACNMQHICAHALASTHAVL